jgi:hypothetical protein
LFIIVAESTEIFAPTQLRFLTASFGVTPRMSSKLAPGTARARSQNDPADGVGGHDQTLPDRVVLAVNRQQVAWRRATPA